MPFVFKSLALLLSISAAFAADKETPFKAGPADSYASHQSNAQITIGVDPFVTADKVALAFGKLNPSQFGILPVLVVIQNDSGKAIRLDRLKVEYAGPNHDRGSHSRPDVRYPQPPAPRRNRGTGRQSQSPQKRKPAGRWEIEGRAMSRKCCRPDNRPAASSFPDCPAARSHALPERPL